MPALREVAAVFGIEFDDSELKQGTESINGAVSALRTLGSSFLSNAFVSGITEFALRFEEDAGRIEDTAAQLGITSQELQELGHAATLGGSGVEGMAAGLANLNRNLGAAKAGPAAEALRRLGVSAKEADGSARSVGDIVDDVAVAMDRIEDPARRAAIAQQLFGGVGRDLLPILKDGEGGVAALRAEFAALGGGLSDDAISAAGEFGDAMDRQRVAMDGLRSVLANAVMPVLARFTEWMKDATVLLVRMTRGTEVFKVALTALGVVAVAVGGRMLLAFAPIIAKVALAAAGVALFILVVDDLITLMRGGDSVIGRFVDRTYGIGTSRSLVNSLNEAWDGMKLVVNDAGDAISRLWSAITTGVTGAGSSVRTYLTDAWDGMKLAAQNAWQAIDDATAGALGRMWARIQAFFAPAVRLLQRLGSALGNEIQTEMTAVNANADTRAMNQAMTPAGAVAGIAENLTSSLSQGIQGIARDWREIVLNVPATAPAGGAAARTQTVAAPAPRTQNVTSTRSTTNQITVHGAPGMDERRLAREVRRQLDAREAAQNDAAHPATHPEES